MDRQDRPQAPCEPRGLTAHSEPALHALDVELVAKGRVTELLQDGALRTLALVLLSAIAAALIAVLISPWLYSSSLFGAYNSEAELEACAARSAEEPLQYVAGFRDWVIAQRCLEVTGDTMGFVLLVAASTAPAALRTKGALLVACSGGIYVAAWLLYAATTPGVPPHSEVFVPVYLSWIGVTAFVDSRSVDVPAAGASRTLRYKLAVYYILLLVPYFGWAFAAPWLNEMSATTVCLVCRCAARTVDFAVRFFGTGAAYIETHTAVFLTLLAKYSWLLQMRIRLTREAQADELATAIAVLAASELLATAAQGYHTKVRMLRSTAAARGLLRRLVSDAPGRHSPCENGDAPKSTLSTTPAPQSAPPGSERCRSTDKLQTPCDFRGRIVATDGRAPVHGDVGVPETEHSGAHDTSPVGPQGHLEKRDCASDGAVRVGQISAACADETKHAALLQRLQRVLRAREHQFQLAAIDCATDFVAELLTIVVIALVMLAGSWRAIDVGRELSQMPEEAGRARVLENTIVQLMTEIIVEVACGAYLRTLLPWKLCIRHKRRCLVALSAFAVVATGVSSQFQHPVTCGGLQEESQHV